MDQYFTGTSSRIEGVGLPVLAREAIEKHRLLIGLLRTPETELSVGGYYQYRIKGERHLLNPETVSKLQHAVRRSQLRHVPGIQQDY